MRKCSICGIRRQYSGMMRHLVDDHGKKMYNYTTLDKINELAPKEKWLG